MRISEVPELITPDKAPYKLQNVVFSGVVHPSLRSEYASDMPNMAAHFAEEMQAIGAPHPQQRGEGVVYIYKAADVISWPMQNEAIIKKGARPLFAITPETARQYVQKGEQRCYIFKEERK